MLGVDAWRGCLAISNGALALVDVEDGADESGGGVILVEMRLNEPPSEHEPALPTVGPRDRNFSLRRGLGSRSIRLSLGVDELEKLIANVGMDLPPDLWGKFVHEGGGFGIHKEAE